AIHAAQTGELPFPKPGGGGPQGTLPLSVRAMPMTPPSDVPRGGEADVDMESASQASGGHPSWQTDVAPKKTAPVVQAVIAEEQRQMEMDFGGQVVDAEAASVVDEVQMRSAVDGLDMLEATMERSKNGVREGI
ncbi:hypothetical protein LCGC14_2355330, partial [marine sediment metagenome]